MGKKLYKSNKNKMLDGVCGGIAEYFNIDPTLVRLGWALTPQNGCGIRAYLTLCCPASALLQTVLIL